MSISVPALVIRLALEESPVIYVDALTDGEWARLADWLGRADYADFVERAIEFAGAKEERA